MSTTYEQTDDGYLANVKEARVNGYDVVCVLCGIGLAQDGCDLHESGCPHTEPLSMGVPVEKPDVDGYAGFDRGSAARGEA